MHGLKTNCSQTNLRWKTITISASSNLFVVNIIKPLGYFDIRTIHYLVHICCHKEKISHDLQSLVYHIIFLPNFSMFMYVLVYVCKYPSLALYFED